MSITSHGTVCDVCASYILPVDPTERVNEFTMPLLEATLHCHNACKAKIQNARNWEDLPNGTLRMRYQLEYHRRQSILDDLLIEQEELEECGDLEDRMAIALKVADAKKALLY